MRLSSQSIWEGWALEIWSCSVLLSLFVRHGCTFPLVISWKLKWVHRPPTSRAITKGREVLAKGLIRRIGDGETTRVGNMNWLPHDGCLRPVMSRRTDKPTW
ncbi:hypothetical protein U9M48_040416, partial [Paspalum notatum var. saurae]